MNESGTDPGATESIESASDDRDRLSSMDSHPQPPSAEPSTSGADDGPSAMERYREQLDTIEHRCRELERMDSRFVKLRAVLFFLAIVFWIVGFSASGAGWIGWICFGLFLVVVVINEPIREQHQQLQRHRSVIGRLIARLQRDWDQLATKGLQRQLSKLELTGHRRDVAVDLDLLGRASLFHLVSMAATTPGIRTLADWMSGPALESIAKQRHAAARALAPMRQQRLRFYTLTREVAESSGDPDHFVQWATGGSWLSRRRWLVRWSNLSSLLTIVMIVLCILGAVGLVTKVAIYALIGLGVLAVVNLTLTAAMLGPVHAIFSVAMANRRAVTDYQELFGAADWLPSKDTPENGFLSDVRHTLVDGEDSALAGMRQLQGIARAGGLRQSAATFLIYLPLQTWGLWDVRVLERLERWQSRYASHVAKWFSALGQLEACMSVAALCDDYPQWSTPQWQPVDQHARLTARQIGHPLLSDQSRIRNDVTLGPPGTILLITGSNMSGKSTMLRSIGLNVSLAAIGGPVCAESMQLPSVELATSIRVSDDISQGVSFYMAELKRLKTVVDQARRLAQATDRMCLFLLDEILQGTNSRERKIAVVQVLKHLMESRAIGAISTHDLDLADDPALRAVAHTVHFRETIQPDADGQEKMTFDYRMRPGVSPTTNALRLLELVGLGKSTQQDDAPESNERPSADDAPS